MSVDASKRETRWPRPSPSAVLFLDFYLIRRIFFKYLAISTIGLPPASISNPFTDRTNCNRGRWYTGILAGGSVSVWAVLGV